MLGWTTKEKDGEKTCINTLFGVRFLYYGVEELGYPRQG